MHIDPAAMILATRATHRELHSARPDAPVVAYRVARSASRTTRARTGLAVLLRRAARAVEPARCALVGEAR